MKKKHVSFMISLVMSAVLPCFPAQAQQHEIEEKEMTVYIGSMEANTEMQICFMDGVKDLPWVELEEWCTLMNLLYETFDNDENYVLSYSLEGETVELMRENGYSMSVDFSENEIYFTDYNEFIHNTMNTSLLDVLSLSGFNEEGEAELFQRSTDLSFDRAGDAVLLSLDDYEIELVFQDGKGYVPLQTLGDFLISPHMLMNTFYNGKAVFIADSDSFGSVEKGLTPLGEYYYSAEPCERSPELSEFGYHELCLALDSLYGLKEIHDIESFDQVFWQIGFDSLLKDPDPETADLALYSFIDYYLDDLHSGFDGYSWMTGAFELERSEGTADKRYDTNYERYYAERTEALGEDVPWYQEVGNTAYITFDEFTSDTGDAYYAVLEDGDLPEDTIGLIIYAHSQIYRENSPIENVVIDLSMNIGGTVDAGIFMISWILGDAPFCVKDTFTGALSTMVYRCDTNLDREFDSGDVVDDKNLFCLISPLSFSCGNLVPAIFKDSQAVTLLGRTSGGGSCTLLPMSSAWGSVFRISGMGRMSFFKNGSYYDIDQGVEPDIYLANIKNYYDRETLTEYINGLI